MSEHLAQTKQFIHDIADTQPAPTPELMRELASHCAILTLDMEKVRELLAAAQREVAILQNENAHLRQQLSEQRRAAKVVVFPAPKPATA